MTEEEALARAQTVVLGLLASTSQPAPDDVDTAIEGAIAALGAMGAPEFDYDRLRRIIESQISIFVGAPALLQDPDEDHDPWLDRRRDAIEWGFWEGYRAFLSRSHPKEVVRSLHRLTDETLDLLEDPEKGGRWDRRGMIVGEVQSGKTSNYTGLICKAADAGYKVIVVLAGIHNSLRSQTQHRLDEGFLGFDSVTTLDPETSGRTRKKLGVGLGGMRTPAAFTLTSSAEDGDFHRSRAEHVAARIGNDPVLLVVKKHRSVLENLIQWLTSTHGEPEAGRDYKVVHDLPLLVIDDEADHASVNTKKIERTFAADGEILDETDPTTINRHIRWLLNSFSRSSLVSYTATPYANIFIREEPAEGKYGEDLFPRSFILRMSAPSDHTGPDALFGIPNQDREGETAKGLPLIRTIDDQDYWLEPKHKKDYGLGPVPPESLRRAVRSFVLATAIRRVRGQREVHNSMLVHVTRYTDVQAQVAEQVQELVDELAEWLGGLAGIRVKEEAENELYALWCEDFAPTSDEMNAAGDETWEVVVQELASVSKAIKVLQVNGTQRDTLAYTDSKSSAVIAIGGDKLSRGLTLEGLTVSYYLRASKMYDTLMQMGRWFGYRPGYLDVTRLYTSREIQSAFRRIAIANEELKEKFDEMSRTGSNPRDFALYVKKSDDLLITAPGKMRDSLPLEIGFAGKIVETIGFSGTADTQAGNLQAVRDLFESNRRHFQSTESHHLLMQDVPGNSVAAFLHTFETVDGARYARARQLEDYVRKQIEKGELVEWTIAAINNSNAAPDRLIPIADADIGLSRRANESSSSGEDSASERIEGRYSIGRLVDPAHELLDLTVTERTRAEEAREAAWVRERAIAEQMGSDPSKMRKLSLGPFARRERPVERGLLLLYMLDPEGTWLNGEVEAVPGFAISFPYSDTAESVSYAVPKRYRDLVG